MKTTQLSKYLNPVWALMLLVASTPAISASCFFNGASIIGDFELGGDAGGNPRGWSVSAPGDVQAVPRAAPLNVANNDCVGMNGNGQFNGFFPLKTGTRTLKSATQTAAGPNQFLTISFEKSYIDPVGNSRAWIVIDGLGGVLAPPNNMRTFVNDAIDPAFRKRASFDLGAGRTCNNLTDKNFAVSIVFTDQGLAPAATVRLDNFSWDCTAGNVTTPGIDFPITPPLIQAVTPVPLPEKVAVPFPLWAVAVLGVGLLGAARRVTRRKN